METQLQEKGIEPLAYKLFCYSSHYRNKLNFTFEGAIASQKALNRLREGYLKELDGKDDISDDIIKKYENRFHEAINDDLNMPSAIGIVWEIIRNENKSEKFAKILLKFDEVLGLDLINAKEYLKKSNEIEIPDEIKDLIQKRSQAKTEKNWEMADKIRDEIRKKGYSIIIYITWKYSIVNPASNNAIVYNVLKKCGSVNVDITILTHCP